MAKVYDELSATHMAFIKAQHVFFVASAPLAADGHVNVSPKGYESLVILSPTKVAYIDLGGSGIETLAHSKENGRITLMFCAFEGKANILRLYGKSSAVSFDEPGFEEAITLFPKYTNARSVITIDITRVADSCGFAVPFYEFKGERDQLREGLAALDQPVDPAAVAAAPLIERIPLAALVGVMFMVVIGTFAWNSLTILRKVPRTDAFVTILVTVVTVATDLATAVVVGVIVSALAYAWNNASRIHAKIHETPEGAKVYQIQGPLFFGSSDGFTELFTVEADPSLVIIDFADSRVVDQSALQAIEAIAGKYEDAGKRIQLRHISHDCHRLLSKAGHLIVDSDDDPDYALAVDYSVKTGILGGH